MRTKGWQKVFKFTFVQYIKSKSFITSTIIVCVLLAAVCVLTNILPAMLISSENNSSAGDGNNPMPFSELSALYISDKISILNENDIQLVRDNGARITETDKSDEDIINQLSTSTAKDMLVIISSDKDADGNILGYTAKTFYSPECSSDDAKNISEYFSELIKRRNLINLGISPEDYEQSQIYVATSQIPAGSKELNAFTSVVNYIIPLVSSLLLFILIFAYGQVVAQSIATEKTSRVMELLLTSVRPLAVVIGKVLAMGLACFIQFFIIGIVSAGSLAISAPFGMIGKISNIISNPDMMNSILGGNAVAGISISEAEAAKSASEFLSGITPLSIILIIVIFILGFLLYSLIAALVGASVSRMEDLQSAMGPYSIIGVIGMYLAYFPTVFNADSLESGASTTNSMQIFSYFFPVSSPFSLPSAIVLNTMSMTQILISVGILAASVILVAVIVGKVYEAIILHNGNRIKMGDIIGMAFRK